MRDRVTYMRFLRTTFALGSALALASSAGCVDTHIDTQRREGGASPNPLGVIQGSVLYVGPRPQCLWTESEPALPVAIRGNVIMLMFDYDNPPPPTGSATTAQSLFALNGRDIFNLSDCMPLTPTADDLLPITRTGRFTWPSIPLGTGPQETDGSYPGRDYQIRGFYDNDGDFNPFFGTRSLATAGDVGGGALVDATAAVPVFRHITFHNEAEEPLGERIQGVAVALGALIDTERPMFTVDDTTRALPSTATIPLISDAIMAEAALWDLTAMRISLVASGDQLDADATGMTRPWGPALSAAGIQYDFNPLVHGMPVQHVDADGNGFGDPHPILGSNGVDWYTPIILLQRARNDFEVRAGIPDVLMIGSIRPTVAGGASQGFIARETFSAADVIVPPVGVIVTNPLQPILCRVPYIPPGNAADIYEAQRSECQVIPSGNYDVNVLAGVAGARVVDVYQDCMTSCVAAGTPMADCQTSCQLAATLRTDTGIIYEGGQYSSQAWSVPNELGCPDLDYHPGALNQLDPVDAMGRIPQCAPHDVPASGSLLLATQSRRGSFAVVDPADFATHAPAADAQRTDRSEGRGVMACQSALHTSGPMAGMVGPIDRSMQTDVPAQCCEPIRRFCDLPLCPLRDEATLAGYPEGVRADASGSHMTREMRVPNEDYRVEADGTVTPLCVPFLMPVNCCQGAPSM